MSIFKFPKDVWDQLKPKEQEAVRIAFRNIYVVNSQTLQYAMRAPQYIPAGCLRSSLSLDTSLTYEEMQEDPKDREIKQLRKKLEELETVKDSIAKLKKFTEEV